MQLKKWFKRILFGFLICIVALILTAISYEQVSRIVADRSYPPEGKLIDAGGHMLHALIKGSGSPTVVFESGLASDGYVAWYKVQDEVARLSTTVAYDRAGINWSERGSNPKTAEAISRELEAMLANGGFEPPYILVGHSFAGITLRPFIYRNLDNIAGIVFVDTTHPDQWNRTPEEMQTDSSGPSRSFMRLLRNLGVLRINMKGIVLPNTEKDDIYNRVTSALIHRASGVMDEMLASDAMMDEVVSMNDFGNISLTIVTGASPTRYEAYPVSQETKAELTNTFHDLQKDLLNLSSQSRQIHAPNSGHYVQFDEPEVVIDAILQLVEQSQVYSNQQP